MDFSPDFQVIEPGLKNTIAVEVDLTSIGCFQKTIFLFGKQFGDARTGRTFMQLNGTALTARIVLQLAPGGIEGITNGNVDIRMGALLAGFVAFDERCLRSFRQSPTSPLLSVLARD